MAEYLLRALDIKKYFAGVKALDGVSLEIRPGEIHCLAGKGMAVIIISDDLPELLENCSRIMILKDGRIADELTADEASEKRILSKML